MKKLILIAAVGKNGIIGNAGGLAWSDPQDLRAFRTTTLGGPVIMGRKTWESLPNGNRPLNGRTNIILTRGGMRTDSAHVVSGLDEAITLAGFASDAADAPAFVIGGAEIYRQFWDYADGAIITHVDADLEGDAAIDLGRLDGFKIEHDSGVIQPTPGHEPYTFRRVTYWRKGLR